MNNQNNITELRAILFDTLRGLKDKSIDVEHAKAISDTAQVIINSAKVEADYAKHNKKKTTHLCTTRSKIHHQTNLMTLMMTIQMIDASWQTLTA